MFVGPDFNTAKSANGVTVVITGGFVLLSKFVSIVGEETIATFVNEPLGGATTVKVKLLVCPEIKLPNSQLIVPPLLTKFPDALENVAPAGIASVTATLAAIEGPKLVTEIV